MALTGLVSSDITEALHLTHETDGGWFILKYATRERVEILAKGVQGVSEAKSVLECSAGASPLYGLIHFRNKMVKLMYVPETLSKALQLRVKAQLPSILAALAPYDHSFSFSKPSEFGEAAIALAMCDVHPPASPLTRHFSLYPKPYQGGGLPRVGTASTGIPTQLHCTAAPNGSTRDSEKTTKHISELVVKSPESSNRESLSPILQKPNDRPISVESRATRSQSDRLPSRDGSTRSLTERDKTLPTLPTTDATPANPRSARMSESVVNETTTQHMSAQDQLQKDSPREITDDTAAVTTSIDTKGSISSSPSMPNTQRPRMTSVWTRGGNISPPLSASSTRGFSIKRDVEAPSKLEHRQQHSFLFQDISSPLLLDKSLKDVFASADQSLINLCIQATIPTTFNINAFLKDSQIERERSRSHPILNAPVHLVLVNWEDAAASISGLGATVSTLKAKSEAGELVQAFKILFVDWRALEILNRDEGGVFVESCGEWVKACLLYTGYKVERFAYGSFSWPELMEFLA